MKKKGVAPVKIEAHPSKQPTQTLKKAVRQKAVAQKAAKQKATNQAPAPRAKAVQTARQ